MTGLRQTLALLLATAAVAWGSTSEPPVDGYAAIVNDRVITVGDVIEYIQPTEIDLRDTYAGEELARKREEAYRTGRDLLIEQALILEEFKKQGANIPDRLVNDRINEFIFERFQNDRAKFLAALAEEQITLEEWRERTRDRVVVGFLRRQEVFDKVQIAPGAILEAYEQKRGTYTEPARAKLHLVVLKKGDDESANLAQREKAVLARGRILAGDDFADVARAISEDPKAEAGGDWGWVEPSMLRSELKDAAENLPPGDISDVIETPDAYYLLQVDERKAAHTKPIEDVRAKIEEDLRRAESERLYRQWIDRLKKKHFVQLY